MKKKIIIALICIVIAIVLAIVAFRVSFEVTRKNNETDINNNTVQENKVKENKTVENTTIENKVKNEIVEKEEAPITEPNTGTSVVPSSAIYESNSDVGTTDKKQDAINLVKNYWGEDSDATFRCDYVDSNGEYIIAVSSIQSASVKGYFRVNLDKKTVDVEY